MDLILGHSGVDDMIDVVIFPDRPEDLNELQKCLRMEKQKE